MSDQYTNKVDADLDPFKRLVSKIPGFSGYIDRQKRRDADKLLRDALAEELEDLWNRISGLQRELINQGEIGFIDDLEAAAIQIRTLADRIKRAPRGYSGLFDAVNINEPELEKMYGYDLKMLDTVDDLERAVDNVELSIGTEGLPASIRHLNKEARECIQAYNNREEVIFEMNSDSAIEASDIDSNSDEIIE
jgi:hypothetical protein